MTWLKLDDTFPDHPKVADLTDQAKWLWVEGLCYAHRTITDGYITPKLVGRRTTQAQELVAARLWVPDPDTPGGYLIHGYLDWYPSRAQIEDKRRRAAEAGRRGAARRWGNDGDTPMPPQ